MLKKRAFNATLWSGADILLRQGLQFASFVILARILSPNEFGTIALLGLFTAIATVLIDGGLSAALIQRRDSDDVDSSTAFWCSLCIGCLTSLSLVLLAPMVARFYRMDALEPLMRLMALNVFIGTLGTTHLALLRKRLLFRRQMWIGVVAGLISGTVAVALALRGAGVWALALQLLVATTITTILLWATTDWRPGWTFSRASARKLFGFGFYYMAASLLDAAYMRLYTVVLGRLSGPRELGYYGNADYTVQLPVGFLNGVFGRVLFPMFAAAGDDIAILRRGKEFGIRSMMLVNIPMMLGLSALARPFVETVFGTRWISAAPVLQVLCLAALLTPLHIINTQLLLARGHSRLLFRVELAKKMLGAMLIVAGAHFGLMGIAWSQVAYSVVSFFVITRYTTPLVNYGPLQQLREIVPALATGLAMAALVAFLDQVWQAAASVKLVVLSFTGASFFIGFVWLLRIEAMQDVLTLFRKVEHVAQDAGR